MQASVVKQRLALPAANVLGIVNIQQQSRMIKNASKVCEISPIRENRVKTLRIQVTHNPARCLRIKSSNDVRDRRKQILERRTQV